MSTQRHGCVWLCTEIVFGLGLRHGSSWKINRTLELGQSAESQAGLHYWRTKENKVWSNFTVMLPHTVSSVSCAPCGDSVPLQLFFIEETTLTAFLPASTSYGPAMHPWVINICRLINTASSLFQCVTLKTMYCLGMNYVKRFLLPNFFALCLWLVGMCTYTSGLNC